MYCHETVIILENMRGDEIASTNSISWRNVIIKKHFTDSKEREREEG